MKFKIFLIVYCIIAAIIFLIIGVTAFKKKICQDKFGLELNQRRRILKIPVIPEYWHVKNKEEHSAYWIDKYGVIGHESKVVVFYGCQIKKEIDIYILKEQDGNPRSIELTYVYAKGNADDSIKTSYLIGHHDNIISRQQADSIFKAEKINPDY
ncbi:MAG: hypothetical protein JWP37_909 [Mucilaginibacter sp.]|nr:hypothetical protein [Mucilaginibacter sp.]